MSSVAVLPRGLARARSLAAAAPAAGGGGAPAVTAATRAWGRALRARAADDGAEPPPFDASPDFVTSHLGFTTDNGAYYYYAPNGTFEQTVALVLDALATRGVPARFLQLDSWWYEKADDGGLLAWAPMTEVFPDGLAGAATRGRRLCTTGGSRRSEYYTGAYTWAPFDAARDVSVLPLDERFFADLPARGGRLGHGRGRRTSSRNNMRESPRASSRPVRLRGPPPRGARRRRARVRRERAVLHGPGGTRAKGARYCARSRTCAHARPHARRDGRARVRRVQRAALLERRLVPYKDGFWSTAAGPTARRAPTATARAAARRAPYPGAAGRASARPELEAALSTLAGAGARPTRDRLNATRTRRRAPPMARCSSPPASRSSTARSRSRRRAPPRALRPGPPPPPLPRM